MAIWIEQIPDGTALHCDHLVLDDLEVEIHSRKNARKLAEAFGCMKAYRRKRLAIRHAEKARRERLKGGTGGAAGGAENQNDERHLRHPERGESPNV